MPVIRITREFTIEMAHVLEFHYGQCKNVHGHSYRLFVTVAGTPLNEPGSPGDGMIMDFAELKKIVEEKVINIFDHSLVVSKSFEKRYNNIRGIFTNLVVLDYQPTCENLVIDFAERIKSGLPDGIYLHSLKLYETSKSYAEWYSSDN
ncbi:MAG TPA: 6-carboxytetrahydropterin synthase [Bacteroidales bacterium]|nr:6-carboxytetrahydropterin synthase [Bacteroidales bacterium]HOK73967.1 6-carboxytetrahydropterin synthase [Bacteroidales bacterium]HOM40025.1 6-carboxytetrahydropterin synthase [Bacteroidales bacterium]HOU30035.1 6-carboxytetrahydropterin synthase [Bacteroidales bacterium]HPP91790.1 6-carboxytetrahydropterin synthase [Bacteroidales bacterium]